MKRLLFKVIEQQKRSEKTPTLLEPCWRQYVYFLFLHTMFHQSPWKSFCILTTYRGKVHCYFSFINYQWEQWWYSFIKHLRKLGFCPNSSKTAKHLVKGFKCFFILLFELDKLLIWESEFNLLCYFLFYVNLDFFF